MKTISIEELERKLQEFENTTISVNLDGIISTEIKLENEKTEKTKDKIVLYNQKNKDIKLALNKHQIMKIEEQNENNILIIFDALQKVNIIKL